MGKRSAFARNPRDYYATPPAAMPALLARLSPGTRFIEPCAGDGRLIGLLEKAGHRCIGATDIQPQRQDIDAEDACTTQWDKPPLFITNPPWDRKVLHKIITNLTAQAPAWLLFDADWAHTGQSIPFIPWLREIVSVGRVKWIEGSKFTGKDNCAWHLFDRNGSGTQFIPRLKRPKVAKLS